MTTNPQQRNSSWLIFAGVSVGLLSGCGPSMPQEPVPLKIGERTFAMRLACDPASRERPRRRSRTPDRRRHDFAFPQRSVRAFWMKDCFIDLDIVLWMIEAGSWILANESRTTAGR